MVYEADPTLAKTLLCNIRWLGLADISVRDTAVWTREGTVGFRRSEWNAGKIADVAESEVNSIRLADEIPETVDLLKLDIEGAEFDVIHDLALTGALSRIDKIIAECHVTHDRLDSFINYFQCFMQRECASCWEVRGLGVASAATQGRLHSLRSKAGNSSSRVCLEGERPLGGRREFAGSRG